MALTYEDLEGRWLAVDSTCVSHLYVYGEDLLVKFLESGRVYVYSGAAKEVVSMMRAPSVGTYFNKVIKDRYPAEPLRNPPPMQQRSGGYDQRY